MSFFAIILFLVGAGLLARGWLGRRVNDSLFCSGCRFDLTGTMRGAVAAGAMEQARCPECGADLGKPGAYRRGMRERRRGMMWSGFVLGAFAIALGGWCAWMVSAGVGVERFEPFWMLRDSAGGRFGKSSPVVQQELARRILAGGLKSAQTDEMVEMAIRTQRQLDKAWGAWPLVIDAAEQMGRLTAAQNQRLREGQIQFKVDLKRRRGDGNTIAMDFRTYARAVSAARTSVGAGYEMRVEVASLQLDRQVIAGPAEETYRPSGVSFEGEGAAVCDWLANGNGQWLTLRAAAGKHILRGRVIITWLDWRFPDQVARPIGESHEFDFQTDVDVYAP